VAYPHDIKGQAIYAFVTLIAGEDGDEALRKQLNQTVRKEIGALAAPDKIHFTPALPKTRSGKIMRRILRKIAEGATEGFGDTSTLADPTIVDALLAGRQ
jgi:acetyl-CoA synthetase